MYEYVKPCFKLNKIHCFDSGYCKKLRINGSRVVDLEKDFATIYKTVAEVGYKSSGLIYQVLKDSSKMMEIQVQILHCTDFRQQFDPNASAFYKSIPVTRLANLLPQYQCCEAFKYYMAQKD